MSMSPAANSWKHLPGARRRAPCRRDGVTRLVGAMGSRALPARWDHAPCRRDGVTRLVGAMGSRALPARWDHALCRRDGITRLAGAMGSRALPARYHRGSDDRVSVLLQPGQAAGQRLRTLRQGDRPLADRFLRAPGPSPEGQDRRVDRLRPHLSSPRLRIRALLPLDLKHVGGYGTSADTPPPATQTSSLPPVGRLFALRAVGSSRLVEAATSPPRNERSRSRDRRPPRPDAGSTGQLIPRSAPAPGWISRLPMT